MPIVSVDIPEQLARFVGAGVRSGRFSRTSEAVVESLRDLEEREREDQAKLDWLTQAAQDSIDQIEAGHFDTLTSREEIDAYTAQIWAETAREIEEEDRGKAVA